MNLIDDLVKQLRRHAPEILTSVGTVGVIGGVILACKETRKIDPIIEDHKKTMNDIHEAVEKGAVVDEETSETAEYTEKDKRRDVTMAYLSTGKKLFKLYLPSTLVLGGSLGCIIGSNRILNKRNSGLAAAYTGVAAAYEEYRKHIIEKFGEDADVEAKYEVKAKKTKDKKGEESTKYKSDTEIKEKDHSRFFDCESIYWDKSMNVNLMTLHSAEVQLNRRLKKRRSHTVALNEVYDALDLKPSNDGQVLGYTYRPGIDSLDANGVPQVIKFGAYILENNKRVLKSVDALIDEGLAQDSVMLLEFPNLTTIV